MNENLGCRFGAISVGGRADGVRGSPCRVGVAVSTRGWAGCVPQDTAHPPLASELLR